MAKKNRNMLRTCQEGCKKNDAFILKLWSNKYQDGTNHLQRKEIIQDKCLLFKAKSFQPHQYDLEKKEHVKNILRKKLIKTKNIRRFPSVLMFL